MFYWYQWKIIQIQVMRHYYTIYKCFTKSRAMAREFARGYRSRRTVQQFLAIFHRVLTPCHCTALSETFVLYDTSNINKSLPKTPQNRRVSKFFPINSHKLRTIRAEDVQTARVLWMRLITSLPCNNRDGCSTARPCILQNVSTRLHVLLTNQIARILVGVVQYKILS